MKMRILVAQAVAGRLYFIRSVERCLLIVVIKQFKEVGMEYEANCDNCPEYMDSKKLIRAMGSSSRESLKKIRDNIGELPDATRQVVEKEIEFALRIIEVGIDE